MTPADHYAEAERLLHVMDVETLDGMTRRECADQAQVHATLATFNPDAARPRKWIGPATYEGRVLDAGGGEVRLALSRNTIDYPDVGSAVHVIVDPFE